MTSTRNVEQMSRWARHLLHIFGYGGETSERC
jgi:hypothetical protein